VSYRRKKRGDDHWSLKKKQQREKVTDDHTFLKKNAYKRTRLKGEWKSDDTAAPKSRVEEKKGKSPKGRVFRGGTSDKTIFSPSQHYRKGNWKGRGGKLQ